MNIAKATGILATRGLITRSQALDSGLSSSDIAHLVRRGSWTIVRRGVYADAQVWDGLDERVGRPRLRTRAAIAVMRRGWVVSHDSAAHELQLDVLTPPEQHVHITRSGTTGAWTAYGVKHHLAGFRDEQVVEAHGLRVLDLARTAVDIAREHGTPYGEVACDAAKRLGVTDGALQLAVEPMLFWPYSRAARSAVAFADAGAESPLETLARILVASLGLADMETQFPVALSDGRVAWCDIRVGCHVFEAHGRVKYEPAAAGGLALRPVGELVAADRKRERLLHLEGLGTSSVLNEDYWNPDRRQVLARMRAEYDDTTARFGDRLPERLVRNARELRDRRDRTGRRGA